MSHKVEAIAGDGATNTMALFCDQYDVDYLPDPYEVPMTENIMSNYRRLKSWPIVKRSYERPQCLYFLTFKPFNKTYDPEKNQLDHIRKKLASNCKYDVLIITREIFATKVHYHALMIAPTPFLDLKLHRQHTNLFEITCVQCPLKDKYQIHEYCVKESKIRYFKKRKDIYVYPNYQYIDLNFDTL